MLKLTDNSLSQLFTIPASTWTVINKRVGAVIAAAPIQNYITPYLSAYPGLLADSNLWEQSTFNGLIAKAGSLAAYAGTAITNFTNLNAAVKKIPDSSGSVPKAIQEQTAALLLQLKQDTDPLAASFISLSGELITFLNDNKAVDAQMATHKAQLSIYWEPLNDYIIAIENAAGLVTGEWNAITDDLKNVLISPIEVTMPFIEALNIDAALVSWQSIQTEAKAFPTTVLGQEQYWVNPF